MTEPRKRGRGRLATLAATVLTIAGLQLFSSPPAHAVTRQIQILATNDFHGRIQNDAASASAGAAVIAGAVKQFRTGNPNTVFAAAGDLIGASTFESFIAKDKPTIDSLNEAGLDVSSVGNHEFDQGLDDLVNRVLAPFDGTTNPYGGASWEYLAANVRQNSNNLHVPQLPPTWTQDFGPVKVGFIGAVTEHLPELVSPAGISTIHVTDVVTEANLAANALKTAGADVIVLLVHEGAPSTNCATMDDNPASDFGSIITGVNDNVDAIVSGHTHLAYNCSFPVPGWSTRPVTQRPVVSAGQYGTNLNQLLFTVEETTGEVQVMAQNLLALKSCANSTACTNYPADTNTENIVSAAVANAAVLGAQELGKISGPFFRGKLDNGTTENRGAESTLGNLVAEVQKWNTRGAESGAAQIAFMNPGGLRADMTATAGPFPRTLTYKQAADVQPFANTLVNMDLTGAQIKTVLEQQWQPVAASRPFLKLGISKGFAYTFDDTKPLGSRITGMWLNGSPINPATVYSVTVNSFLAAGGDNFVALSGGTNKQDTGKTDLQGMVDYMAAFGGGSGIVPDYRQNGVGVTFAASEPATYKPNEHVKFNVSSWSMTNAVDVKDTAVVVQAGATTLGTFALDNSPQAALPGFDTVGKATVDVVVPNTQGAGVMNLTLTGASTGTTATVPVNVVQAQSTVSASLKTAKPRVGKKVVLRVQVTGENGVPANGQATATIKGTAITVNVVNGVAQINLGKFARNGVKTVNVRYLGSPALGQSTTALTFKVKKQKK